MENSFLITKCMLRPNEGSSLKEDYDIVAGNPIIDYYESIESPSISMTITFIDIDQVIGRKGITGGEYIDLIVKIDDEDADDFKITVEKQKMMLNSVRNMVTESNKQVATLEFVSVETIVNETARVNKKYTGNISETVVELLVADSKGIQTSKKLFGPKEDDRATNSYSFVGNLKRPFDTIQWLCPKAQSATDDFGFLFYETLDGYHFRSIKSLLEQDAITYQQTDAQGISNKILQNNLNQSNDIGMNMRMGMYANRTIYVDIENQNTDVVDFKASELKLNKPATLLTGIENYPTRLMVRVDDVGVAQKGSKKEDEQPKSELARYQNKSYIRNNLLFSQSLSISIPLNTTLRAGFALDIRLPLKQENGDAAVDSYGNERSNDPSGRYLIAELRHLIGGGKGETQLKLVRDVFTVNKTGITDTGELIRADNRQYGNTWPAGSR
tara:strand:- start:1070 stop:2395 length:1326 start_codon:yes stop_codon:yes gene_type:complete